MLLILMRLGGKCRVLDIFIPIFLSHIFIPYFMQIKHMNGVYWLFIFLQTKI